MLLTREIAFTCFEGVAYTRQHLQKRNIACLVMHQLGSKLVEFN